MAKGTTRTMQEPMSVRLDGSRLRHVGGVRAVRWSPRGDVIASVGFDERLTLWSARDGSLVRSLATGGRFVSALCFSPDGAQVLSGAKVLRVWDVVTGAARLSLRHRDDVASADWSPDGATIATASDDRRVRLFDAATGNVRASWRFEDAVRFVRFSPDGRHLLAASGWEVLLLTADGATVASAMGADGNGRIAAAFTPDGAGVLVAPHDRRELHRLRVPSLETIAEVELDHGLRCVAVSPDGRFAAFGGFGRYAPTPHPEQVGKRSVHSTYVSLWRLDPWEPAARLRGHTELVEGVAFSPDGASLAACSGDGTVRVWNVDEARPALVPEAGFESDPHGGVWLDTETVAVCASTETVLWRAVGGPPVALAWDASHHQVERCEGGFVAMGDRVVSRWRVDGASVVPVWTSPCGTAQYASLACSGDGARVFAGDGEGTVTAWFDGAPAPRWTLSLGSGSVLALACASDGAWLAATCGHEPAWFRVRGDGSGAERVALPDPEEPGAPAYTRYVCAAAITGDGARVVLALVGGDVEVCDAVTGARVLRIAARVVGGVGTYGGFGAPCVALSPDGGEVAVSARYANDTRVRVYSLGDGAPRGETSSADGVIDVVRWSPDGTRLLTVGFRAHEVRVWRVAALRGRAKRT